MDLFGIGLFFGLHCSAELNDKLSKVNPLYKSLFIREGDEYLQELIFENKTYIGKYIGKTTHLEQLERLEANIISLLKKLVPDYSYENVNLELLPSVQK